MSFTQDEVQEMNQQKKQTLLDRIQRIVDRATIEDEAAVKRVVRRVLDKAGVYTFMPPANAFGKSGISDIIAIKYGKAVFIETKFGYNKPTAMQLAFGGQVKAAGCPFLVVNEKNLVEYMTQVVLYYEGYSTGLLEETWE